MQMEGRRYKTKKETLLHGLPTEAGNYFPQVNFYTSLNVFGQISGKKKKKSEVSFTTTTLFWVREVQATND